MQKRPTTALLDSSKMLAAWKEAADRLRSTGNLGDDFDRRVQEVFGKTIVRGYWKPVYERAVGQCNWSQSELALKLGISRATINRWDGDLVGRPNKTSIEPSLSSFLLILCAFRIDHGDLPDGLTVAMEAYREAFAVASEAVVGARPESPVRDEEILCLHFTCRSRLWLEAQLDADENLAAEAAAEICGDVAQFVPTSSIRSIDQVRETVDRHIKTWSVLETVILYEWFQSKDFPG